MNFRLQSAMEYLMTYGWAILIIAVVLLGLYSIGVFNVGSGTSCTPSGAQYLCNNPIYSHSTGNITVTLGESTGTWNTASVAFVNQSAESRVQNSGLTGIPQVSITNGLIAGASVTVTLPATGAVKLGTPISGFIWVSYTTQSTPGTTQLAQLATFSAKAT